MIPEDDFIRIGVVTGAHGLNGRLKVHIVTDIEERFSPGNRVFISSGGEGNYFTVAELIVRKERKGLLKLDGIDTAEQAAGCKGAEILIATGDALGYRNKLGTEEYLYSDIIGCNVLCDGSEFGVVADILRAGSGEILIVAAKDGKQHMIPFVSSMVDTSRISDKRIVIYPVEGLFDI